MTDFYMCEDCAAEEDHDGNKRRVWVLCPSCLDALENPPEDETEEEETP